MTSSMERSSTCASGAATKIARVITGRMRLWASLAPMTGTQPKPKEKIWIKMMPIQKVGRETITEGRLRKKLRSQENGPKVETIATRKARTTPTRKAKTASASVEGRASASISDTAVPVATEKPKSPVRNPPSALK